MRNLQRYSIAGRCLCLERILTAQSNRYFRQRAVPFGRRVTLGFALMSTLVLVQPARADDNCSYLQRWSVPEGAAS